MDEQASLPAPDAPCSPHVHRSPSCSSCRVIIVLLVLFYSTTPAPPASDSKAVTLQSAGSVGAIEAAVKEKLILELSISNDKLEVGGWFPACA